MSRSHSPLQIREEELLKRSYRSVQVERGNYVQENTVISDNHLRIGHVGHGVVDWHTDFFFFFLFIHLLGCTGSQLQHVESSFLTGDQTWALLGGESQPLAREVPMLIVLRTINLQFQGQFVPISLRPVLGSTSGGSAYVMTAIWPSYIKSAYSTW